MIILENFLKLSIREIHCGYPLEDSNSKHMLSYRTEERYPWHKQVWANSADPDQTAPRGAV